MLLKLFKKYVTKSSRSVQDYGLATWVWPRGGNPPPSRPDAGVELGWIPSTRYTYIYKSKKKSWDYTHMIFMLHLLLFPETLNMTMNNKKVTYISQI